MLPVALQTVPSLFIDEQRSGLGAYSPAAMFISDGLASAILTHSRCMHLTQAGNKAYASERRLLKPSTLC